MYHNVSQIARGQWENVFVERAFRRYAKYWSILGGCIRMTQPRIGCFNQFKVLLIAKDYEERISNIICYCWVGE